MCLARYSGSLGRGEEPPERSLEPRLECFSLDSEGVIG
jgi:hypothetical protein